MNTNISSMEIPGYTPIKIEQPKVSPLQNAIDTITGAKRRTAPCCENTYNIILDPSTREQPTKLEARLQNYADRIEVEEGKGFPKPPGHATTEAELAAYRRADKKRFPNGITGRSSL